MNQLSHRLVGYILSLIVVVSFAVYPSVSPLGLASQASPFGFVFLAMMISTLGIGTLVLVRGDKLLPTKNEIPSLTLISLIFLLEHVCLLYALKYLQVPVAMSLIYLYPFAVAGLEIIGGKERISLRLFGPLTLCLLGVSLVIGFSVEQLDIVGISLAIGQALMAASRIVLTAKLVKNTAGLLLTARMLLFAVLLALPILALLPVVPPQTPLGWLAVSLAGLSGMIGHGCLAQALKRIDPITFSVIMNLEPVVAAILSALFVGQLLTLQQYLGGILVICAVIVYGRLKKASD